MNERRHPIAGATRPISTLFVLVHGAKRNEQTKTYEKNVKFMDNLANLFSIIQNSQMRRKKSVFLKFSKIAWNICTVLFVEGFIQGFERKNENILVYLKYLQDKPIINKISKISLQGRRVYIKNTGILCAPQHNIENFTISHPESEQPEAPKLNQKSNSSSKKYSLHVAKGLGIKILSTSKGILSERDARFFGIGGEILCEVF